MENFKDKVLAFVKSIPAGRVVSYGQVASACGNPRAAREVGWALNTLDGVETTIPWWRVVNSKGYLSIRGTDAATKDVQKALLEKEGIIVDADYMLDIEKYRYK